MIFLLLLLLYCNFIYCDDLGNIVIENLDDDSDILLSEFNAYNVINYYYNNRNVTIDNLSVVLDSCEDNFIIDNKNIIINRFHNYYRLNILDISNNIKNLYDINVNLYWNISDSLNHCYYNQTNNGYIKDMLLHISIVIWPWNHVALKNLGLKLLNDGFYSASLKLFDDCTVITDNFGCIIYHVFIVPPHFWSTQQTNQLFYDVMSKVNRALSIKVNINIQDPTNLISSMPTYMQYLGISPRILSESYSKVINHMFPILIQPYFSSNNDNDNHDNNNDKNNNSNSNITSIPIRLGIVSEDEMNSSPGLCFTQIFSRLIIQSIERNDGRKIEIIYFARTNPMTVFAYVAMRTSYKVIYLNHENFQSSYYSILNEKLDVLLYLGLPTNDKYTSFLSQMRLAPIQLQFGVGHPLTSGSLAIDYTISSSLYHDVSYAKNQEINADMCLSLIKSNNDNEFHSKCNIQGPSANTYVEQLVLFDTLSYFIRDPVKYYIEANNFLNTRTIKSATLAQCQDIDDYLNDIELSDWNITAASLGCRYSSNDSIRLYMLVQTSRKLHPSMDEAIFQILNADSGARIIVNKASKSVLLHRTSKSAPLYLNDIMTRVIPIEKRIEHKNYLRLLSLSSVFLNPFPYGSGITSAEAIAFCIPIIVYPKAISYTQLALGQLRILELPPNIEEFYIANSITDYVQKAVRAAIQRQRYNEDHYCIDNNKDKLFSPNHLEDTVDEWINFIRNVVI